MIEVKACDGCERCEGVDWTKDNLLEEAFLELGMAKDYYELQTRMNITTFDAVKLAMDNFAAKKIDDFKIASFDPIKELRKAEERIAELEAERLIGEPEKPEGKLTFMPVIWFALLAAILLTIHAFFGGR